MHISKLNRLLIDDEFSPVNKSTYILYPLSNFYRGFFLQISCFIIRETKCLKVNRIEIVNVIVWLFSTKTIDVTSIQQTSFLKVNYLDYYYSTKWLFYNPLFLSDCLSVIKAAK